MCIVEPVRTGNREEEPAGWGCDHRTRLPRRGTDTWGQQGRDLPTSFSSRRLISFSSSPIGWARKKPARKGGGGTWPAQISLGTEQREGQDHSGWAEERFSGYFYLLYSSSEDPLSHLKPTGIRSVAMTQLKMALPLGRVSTIFEVTYWHGYMTRIKRHYRKKCVIDNVTPKKKY